VEEYSSGYERLLSPSPQFVDVQDDEPNSPSKRLDTNLRRISPSSDVGNGSEVARLLHPHKKAALGKQTSPD